MKFQSCLKRFQTPRRWRLTIVLNSWGLQGSYIWHCVCFYHTYILSRDEISGLRGFSARLRRSNEQLVEPSLNWRQNRGVATTLFMLQRPKNSGRVCGYVGCWSQVRGERQMSAIVTVGTPNHDFTRYKFISALRFQPSPSIILAESHETGAAYSTDYCPPQRHSLRRRPLHTAHFIDEHLSQCHMLLWLHSDKFRSLISWPPFTQRGFPLFLSCLWTAFC